jgi:WD40 repeat protein
MNYYSTIEKYISAATDGTICIWRYEVKPRLLVRECEFVEPSKYSIRSFVYDIRTRDLIYTTSEHCFGLWRIFTNHQQSIETELQSVSTLEIYQVKESSFLITISRSNMVAVYRMPGLECCGSWYMGMQHDMCPPTGCIILNGYLFLVGAFLSCWKLENAESNGERPHGHRLVGALTNDVFSSVISVDRYGEVCTWDMNRGTKNYSYTLHEPGRRVTCFALDTAERRMGVGYSDGLIRIVSAVSGSELSQIDRQYIEKGCAWVHFGRIFGQKRMIACTGARSIVLFEDLGGTRHRFIRSFVGHAEELVMATIVKDHFIVSVGTGIELILWNVTYPGPVIRYKLKNDPTTVADLVSDQTQFLAGDTGGFIHFLSITDQAPLRTINAFRLSIKSPISRIRILPSDGSLVTTNLHGYVKYWRLKDPDLEEIRVFRAHSDAVVDCAVSPGRRIVATVGDEQIRLWGIDTFGMLGSLGTGRLWKGADPSTWAREDGFEIDPVHFSVSEPDAAADAANPPDASPVEDASEEEEKAADVDHTVPQLSMAAVALAMDSIEDVLAAGDRILSTRRQKIEEIIYPLTSRPPPIQRLPDEWARPAMTRPDPFGRTLYPIEAAKPKPKIVRPVAT